MNGDIAEMMPSAINHVQIALDGYDDIFSDFDPSPYKNRLLSDDFLKEIQNRYGINKKGTFELRLMVPKEKRDLKLEAVIKKRIKDYFYLREKELRTTLKERKKKGVFWLLVGILALAADLVAITYEPESFLVRLIELILLPAGWFFTYAGLEHILDLPRDFTERLKFMEKFKAANYVFLSEEDLFGEEKKRPEPKVKLPEIMQEHESAIRILHK